MRKLSIWKKEKIIRKSNVYFLCFFVVFVLTVPFLAWAEEVQLTIKPTSVYAGDSVTVSGTSDSSTWITIKVLDNEGNIVYLNSIISDENGNYTDTFTAPDMAPGELYVVTGYGSSVSESILILKKKRSSKGDDSDLNKMEKKEDGSVVITTSKPEVNKETGKAKVKITYDEYEEAIKKADTDDEGEKKVQIQIPSSKNDKGYEIELPRDALKENEGNVIKIKTDIGEVLLSGNMLKKEETEETDNISLSFRNVDKEELDNYSNIDEETREKIGDRPIIEISFLENGKTKSWENEETQVTISIPYKLQSGEDPEHVVVWYIDGEGNVVTVPNGRYNTETGMVEFNVTHFSIYAVAYIEKTFDDLDDYLWAKHEIEVLASKGIINGTSSDIFSPNAKITRADYLTLLVKTLELTADFDSNFSDIEPDTYYYEAIGIAKKLGITGGVGDNLFNPKEKITRQDMMVLTVRALEKFKGLKVVEDSSVLDKFNDKENISCYASESLSTLVNEGLITGAGDKMNPKANSTRAEAAVFLYRIYKKF